METGWQMTAESPLRTQDSSGLAVASLAVAAAASPFFLLLFLLPFFLTGGQGYYRGKLSLVVAFVHVTVNRSRNVPEIYVGIRLKHNSFCLLCVCGGGSTHVPWFGRQFPPSMRALRISLGLSGLCSRRLYPGPERIQAWFCQCARHGEPTIQILGLA